MPIVATNLFPDPRGTANTSFERNTPYDIGAGAALDGVATSRMFTRNSTGAARFGLVLGTSMPLNTVLQVRLTIRASEAIPSVTTSSRPTAGTSTGSNAGPTLSIPQGVSEQVFTVTSHSAASTSTAGIVFIENSTAIGATIEVTKVSIVASSTPVQYFDGSTPSDMASIFAWNGTPDASTSTMFSYINIDLQPDGRKRMWFGTESKFLAVPAPASGMAASNVGYTESLRYQNGRMGVVRSMQTHKEFDMDFPVQEASGLNGIDVFNKFASGFYGDMDDYPIFFADPMNYDQNLMPTHFAQPGLYRRGWAAIVDDSARRYVNYATNPSAEGSAVGWSGIAGTSGVLINTGSTGPDSSLAYAGRYRWQQTWSVATTAISGGVAYTGTAASAGKFYGASMYVNSVSKQQRFQATIRFRNSSSTSIGTATGTQVVGGTNTWIQVVAPITVAPAGTASVDIEVVAVTGTNGSNWGINNILRADAAMVYENVAPPQYFDGDSVGAAWIGAANSSQSALYVSRVTPTFVNTPANSYNLPPQSVIWSIPSWAGEEPGPSSNIPYAIIPIPPGYRLHFGWTGSVTGTAQVVVEGWNAPLSKQSTTVATPLSETGATRMNVAIDSVDYAKIYLRRTDNSVSTVTISSMMAQLHPVYKTPNLSGNFIEGKGHRGLKFADDATVESYVMVDPNRNVPVHYKGLSTRLVEAQDKG